MRAICIRGGFDTFATEYTELNRVHRDGLTTEGTEGTEWASRWLAAVYVAGRIPCPKTREGERRVVRALSICGGFDTFATEYTELNRVHRDGLTTETQRAQSGPSRWLAPTGFRGYVGLGDINHRDTVGTEGASQGLAPTGFEVIGVGIWAWAGEPRLAPTDFEVIGVGIWAWAGEPMARPYRIRGYWGWDMGVSGRADGSPLQDSRLLGLGYGRGRASQGSPLQDSRLLGLGYGRGRASRGLAPTGFEVIRAGIWAWAGEPMACPYRIRGYWGWDMGVGGRADGSPLQDSRLLGLGYGRGRASRGSRLQDSRLLGLGYGRGRASRWLAPTGFEVVGVGIWA